MSGQPPSPQPRRRQPRISTDSDVAAALPTLDSVRSDDAPNGSGRRPRSPTQKPVQAHGDAAIPIEVARRSSTKDVADAEVAIQEAFRTRALPVRLWEAASGLMLAAQHIRPKHRPRFQKHGSLQPHSEPRPRTPPAAQGGAGKYQVMPAGQPRRARVPLATKASAWAMYTLRCVLDFVVNAVCRSIGQVAFVNNPLGGLVIMVALCWPLPLQYFVLGSVGVVVSNLVALWLGLGHVAINNGLFGFNGVLVGQAIATFVVVESTYEWVAALLAVAAFSAMSGVIVQALGNLLVETHKVPPLTLPFNIATLMLLLVMRGLPGASHLRFHSFMAPAAFSTDDVAAENYWDALGADGFVKAVFRGVAQIWLCNHYVSGVVVVCAMMLYSRVLAAMSVVGSIVGMLTAMAFGVPSTSILAGLWGYNGTLSAGAVGGLFYMLDARSFVLACFTAAMATAVQGALAACFQPYGLPVLTLPFCIATLFAMLLRVFQPVGLATVTYPEQHRHRYYLLRRQQRRGVRDALVSFGVAYRTFMLAVDQYTPLQVVVPSRTSYVLPVRAARILLNAKSGYSKSFRRRSVVALRTPRAAASASAGAATSIGGHLLDDPLTLAGLDSVRSTTPSGRHPRRSDAEPRRWTRKLDALGGSSDSKMAASPRAAGATTPQPGGGGGSGGGSGGGQLSRVKEGAAATGTTPPQPAPGAAAHPVPRITLSGSLRRSARSSSRGHHDGGLGLDSGDEFGDDGEGGVTFQAIMTGVGVPAGLDAAALRKALLLPQLIGSFATLVGKATLKRGLAKKPQTGYGHFTGALQATRARHKVDV